MVTLKEQKMHERLRRICAQFETSMESIVVILLDVARLKFYLKWGRRSLVDYIIEDLKIDSVFTFDLNRVVRAAMQYPDLERALRENKITVGKATRILSSLGPENIHELVAFASTHTFAEINSFVAARNPHAKYRESWKQLSADQYKITVILTAKEFKDLQRSQSLLAQKRKPAKMGAAVAAALATHLWRHDPVEKAARAKTGQEAKSPRKTAPTADAPAGQTAGKPAGNSAGKSARNSAGKSKNEIVPTSEIPTGRIPLTAAERHAVFRKTGGRCTFIENGERCGCDRGVEIHHIIHVADGGTNDISNLTHLCWVHHDLIHQLWLPLDELTTYVRA